MIARALAVLVVACTAAQPRVSSAQATPSGSPQASPAEATPYRLFPEQLKPVAFAFELGWTGITLRPDARDKYGVGSGNFFSLGLGAVFYDLLAVSVDGGVGGYEDKRQFEVVTVDPYTGDTSTDKSSVAGWFLDCRAGLRTPRLFIPGTSSTVGVTLGADLGLFAHSEERRVADCSDCPTEKLDIRDGAFYALQLAVGMTNRESLGVRLFGVGVAYRRFFAPAEPESSIVVTLGTY